MGQPLELPGDQYVYRLLTPTSWDPPPKNRPKTNFFRRRANEQSVSVYRADRQTPRGALQCCIDAQMRKLQSESEEARANAENFLYRYGNSVESLVQNDWRVARLPIPELTRRGFRLSEPDNTGHQDVYAEREELGRYSNELVQCAVILSREECLSG